MLQGKMSYSSSECDAFFESCSTMYCDTDKEETVSQMMKEYFSVL